MRTSGQKCLEDFSETADFHSVTNCPIIDSCGYKSLLIHCAPYLIASGEPNRCQLCTAGMGRCQADWPGLPLDVLQEIAHRVLDEGPGSSAGFQSMAQACRSWNAALRNMPGLALTPLRLEAVRYVQAGALDLVARNATHRLDATSAARLATYTGLHTLKLSGAFPIAARALQVCAAAAGGLQVLHLVDCSFGAQWDHFASMQAVAAIGRLTALTELRMTGFQLYPPLDFEALAQLLRLQTLDLRGAALYNDVRCANPQQLKWCK